MPPVRTVIADDHPEALSALVSVLTDDARFEVVATARTAAEVVPLAGALHPDAVLLDVRMPGSGTTAARALRDLPDPPVVIAISADVGTAGIEDMLRAGATGFLTKGQIGDTLPDLLVRCAEGQVVLATPGAAAALHGLLGLREVPRVC